MRQERLVCDNCGADISGPYVLMRIRHAPDGGAVTDLDALPPLLRQFTTMPGHQGEVCLACCTAAFPAAPDGDADTSLPGE